MRRLRRGWKVSALLCVGVGLAVAVALVERDADPAAANPSASPTATHPEPLGPDAELLAQEAAEPNEPPVGLTAGETFTFLGRGFVNETSWGKMHDGVLTKVFAGTWADDPDAGVVAVVSWRWNEEFPDPRDAVYYRAPRGVGRLSITGTANAVLSLASASGATGTFDLTARTLAIDPPNT